MVRAYVERRYGRSAGLNESLAQVAVQDVELRFIDEPSRNHGLIRDDDAQIPLLVNRPKRLHDARDDLDLTIVRQEVDVFHKDTVAIEEERAFALQALLGFSHLWKYAVIK